VALQKAIAILLQENMVKGGNKSVATQKTSELFGETCKNCSLDVVTDIPLISLNIKAN